MVNRADASRNDILTACNGFTYIKTLDIVYSGSWFAVSALEDTYIYNITGSAEIDGDSITNMFLPAGLTLYGRFENIQLTSGSIIGYKG